MKNAWKSLPGWVRKLSVLTLIALPIGGVYMAYNRVYLTEEESCLASIINSQLDRLAITKGTAHYDIADEQAEIIGRVQVRRAKEYKVTFCAEAISRRLAQARWNYFTGPKDQSERWRLVFAAARRAASENYKYPLRDGCTAVKSYRQTYVRGWAEAWKNRGSPGYSVGNMRAFCD